MTVSSEQVALHLNRTNFIGRQWPCELHTKSQLQPRLVTQVTFEPLIWNVLPHRAPMRASTLYVFFPPTFHLLRDKHVIE